MSQRFLALAAALLLVAGCVGLVSPRLAAGRPPRPPAGGVPAPVPPPASPACGWQIVPGANASGEITALRGVAAHTANHIWAVGFASTGGRYQGLIEHWDGTQWTVVPSPNGITGDTFLQSVTTVAADEAWAVGYSGAGAPQWQTLILHWTGTQWTVVPSPNPGINYNFLLDVVAVSADDVWAMGYTVSGTVIRTLILHWDGAYWTVAPSPSPGLGEIRLNGVARVTATDVWAVGSYGTVTGTQTLTLHWDGTQWSQVSSPNPGSSYNELAAVTALTATDVWAVGGHGTANVYQPLTLHWNGTQWQVVPSPNGAAGASYLRGAQARAGPDVWAVGAAATAGGGQAIILHWDGTQWRLEVPPGPSPRPELYDVVGISATEAWAVGDYRDANNSRRALIMRYTGPCGAGTPTGTVGPPPATGTPTPPATGTAPAGATRTGTPIPASATATPPPEPTGTPTPCSLSYWDVPPASPFYGFIRCLACRGIVSGYSDGSFRPFADVTRGQLAKILAGAAGLTASIPSTQQTFSDVPAPNPFWVFIERLAATGAISGYGCGAPGEPCDPAQRPYFRWGANATRGQIAKIAALAAQLQDPVPPQQQTFADVPSPNAFWLWIEQLAGRSIISGYGCGAPGEPCDPAQRPYFRPNANTTRSQLAKIAAQTFFPDCRTPLRR